MEIENLRYFMEICKTGSFTIAAENCNISQSSLSKRIKVLEAELGTELFIRQHRSFVVTDAGRIVLEHAARILDIQEQMDSDLETLRRANDNVVNLALLGYATHYGLWPLIMNFFYRHSEVQNQVKIMSSDEMRRRIRHNESILCICYDHGFDSMDVCKFPLAADYYSVIIPARHPLYEREEISIYDLEGQDVCIQNEDSQIRRIMDRTIEDLQIHYHVRYTDFFPDSIFRTAILNNYLYPSLRNASSVYIPQDIRIAVFKEKITADLVLVWQKDRRLSESELAFVQFLKEHISSLIQKDDNAHEKFSSMDEKIMLGAIKDWM